MLRPLVRTVAQVAVETFAKRRFVENEGRAAALLETLASLLGLLLVGRPLIRVAYGDTYVGAWGILLVLAVVRSAPFQMKTKAIEDH